ncbi:hypothetical protein [Nonomuraea sp. B5E05]|uniref:hypothetical protein n=1 Tax=Nonomuraea sp. B5E05 TaxID=3153569 RepID=UPI00325FF2D3
MTFERESAGRFPIKIGDPSWALRTHSRDTETSCGHVVLPRIARILVPDRVDPATGQLIPGARARLCRQEISYGMISARAEAPPMP